MCGIAGFLNYEKHRDFGLAANEIQQHRGPDSQAIWSNANLTLSHQRLSIIDVVERSNQPMESGNLVIVFNGEIYNYKTLRQELQNSENVSFRTNSDTEVVLELFRHMGTRCMQKLIGMFSFAIFNKESGELIVARDHFGIKPLYYLSDGMNFAFSSELKALRKTVGADLDVNMAALSTSMRLLWLPEEFCIFEKIRKLPPAHFLRVQRDGTVKEEKYWELPDSPALDISETDAVELIAANLEESVERHLVSDVEVGSFLSGGLDSSLVSTIAMRKLGKLRTFTIGMSEADKKIEGMADDQKYAEMIAAKEGFDHQSIVIKPDLVSLLSDTVHSLDEPVGDPAALNTRLICQAANQAGLKVLLSGMGADEVFFGYRRQKAWLYAKQYRKIPSLLRAPVKVVANALPVQIGDRGFKLARWSQKFLSFAELPDSPSYLRSYTHYDANELGQLIPDVDMHVVEQLDSYHASVMATSHQSDPVNKLCQTDIQLFMTGLNLFYTDRSSMSESIEVRVPFIDRPLLEAGMQLPGSLKFKNGTSKYILKKVAERYLPHDLIYRPKSNFAVPIRRWLANELSEFVGDLLSPTAIKARGWFDPDKVSQIINDHNSGKSDYSARIYQLLTAELWAQKMLDG